MRQHCARTGRHLSFASASARSFTHSACLRRAYQDGDVVLLRSYKDSHGDGLLIKLKAGKDTGTHKGVIKHFDVIGKESRQTVKSSKGHSYRIHEPTLAEYVRLTPRLVTPIYPSDTNLIVSLLDIHVETPSNGLRSEPPLEILEAGTGHGALTLHLSRAIHAANPPMPRTPTGARNQEDESEHSSEDAIYLGESIADLQSDALKSWRADRRAIIHTLDIAHKHSNHAKNIIEGFRHGLYAGNIDYHVGDVSDWIAEQTEKRENTEPFLTHVFLDLPNADKHLANVAPALHVNGLLAVFNPSITQIAECVDAIRAQRMPYLLDQVVELGAGTIREWDVRQVKPRAASKVPIVSESAGNTSDDAQNGKVLGQESRDEEFAEGLEKQDEKWAMVCRPKAGQQVVGGGFLALWRRMEKTNGKEE